MILLVDVDVVDDGGDDYDDNMNNYPDDNDYRLRSSSDR